MKKYLYSHFKTISCLFVFLGVLGTVTGPAFAQDNTISITLPPTAGQCWNLLKSDSYNAQDLDKETAQKDVDLCMKGADEIKALKPTGNITQAILDMSIFRMYNVAQTAVYIATDKSISDSCQYLINYPVPYAEIILSKYYTVAPDEDWNAAFKFLSKIRFYCLGKANSTL